MMNDFFYHKIISETQRKYFHIKSLNITFYLVNLGGGGQRFEKYMPFYYGDFDIFINAIYNGKWYVYI